MVDHDRGLYRGVSHTTKQGGELRPPLSQKARHGGFARSHHNHTVDGECSDHTGHDDGSPTDDGVAVKNQPPFRAMSCSSRGAAGVRLCLVVHRRARGNATMKPAHRQLSYYHGSTARATVVRAHTRGGEDVDGGLRLHSSSGQGGGSPCQSRTGLG
jgi:hypothetical protein